MRLSSLLCVIALVLLLVLVPLLAGCDTRSAPVSASGVAQAAVTVPVDAQGHTVEQRNIMERVARDNKPGSVKHLYCISPYSGQVVIYSTVQGKVTSSGKRLTPSSYNQMYMDASSTTGAADMTFKLGDRYASTKEILGDDGTYGSSGQYLFWLDQRGVYHQHYLGNEILHISDQPLAVKDVVINMELAAPQK